MASNVDQVSEEYAVAVCELVSKVTMTCGMVAAVWMNQQEGRDFQT
jgi:hypothetical protein